MSKMKAALFYGGKKDIRVENIDIPPLSKGDVLVKVRTCGICGSDARSYFNGVEERYKIPVILGHEVMGEVAEAGDGTDLTRGERVVVAPIYGCGHCDFCVSDEENLCDQVVVFGCNFDGAFAEYMKIPQAGVARGVVAKVPRDISDEEATLIEPFSCCLHGIKRINLSPGDTVVVTGAGPIGLAHITLLKMLGAGRVIANDIVDERLSRAKDFGADVTINSARENLVKKVKDLTGGKGVDSLIAAAPSPKATEVGIDLIRKGGRLLIFGGCPSGSRITIDPNLIHYAEISMTGSIDSTMEDFRETIDLVHRADLAPFVTHRFSLDAIREAMEVMGKKEGLKVIITL